MLSALCAGTNVGIDPKLTYKGCTFEAYSGKYTYTCKGNGKHIYGRGKFVERDAMSATRNGTPGAGGGTYYGECVDLMEDENSVVLAVPIAGPGFGSSRFAVVRVGESPGSLKQRLLANKPTKPRLKPQKTSLILDKNTLIYMIL